jgi:hypothetical protein
VVLRFTRLAGSNALISGLFFGAPAPTPVPPSVTFVASDPATQGSWQGVYGSNGYNVLGDRASYPAYASVTASGQSSFTWAASTSDPRALQKASDPTSHVAACWYSGTSFTVDVNLTDGQAHRMALHFLDWDGMARIGQVRISDPSTGAVLDTRTVSSFRSGSYLAYTVSGHFVISITKQGGPNAVLSGIFFDPPPPSSPAASATIATAAAAPSSERAPRVEALNLYTGGPSVFPSPPFARRTPDRGAGRVQPQLVQLATSRPAIRRASAWTAAARWRQEGPA